MAIFEKCSGQPKLDSKLGFPSATAGGNPPFAICGLLLDSKRPQATNLVDIVGKHFEQNLLAIGLKWWAHQDSNLGQTDYEAVQPDPVEFSNLKNSKRFSPA